MIVDREFVKMSGSGNDFVMVDARTEPRGPLGEPTDFVSTGQSLRGGMTIRSYRINAGKLVLSLTTMTLPDGKIEQYIVERAG